MRWRNHRRHEDAQGSAGSQNRRRGFSTLETVIALSLFLVVAGSVAVASLQISSSLNRSQGQVGVAAAIDTRLDVLGSYRYEELVGESFAAPDMCGTTGDDRKASCVTIDGVTLRISYMVTPIAPEADSAVAAAVTSAAVQITATVELPDGTSVSRVRKIVPPSVGYTGQDAVLRVRKVTDAVDPLPLVLLDTTGNVVVPSITFTDSLALVKVPGDACAGERAPCRLALSSAPASWWEAGDYTLAVTDIMGPSNRFQLSPGGFAEAIVTVNRKAAATVRVLAEPTGGVASDGAYPGSVCLWGTFDAGGVTRSMPYCNTGDGKTISISSFYDPATAKTYPLAVGTVVTLRVDHPDRVCQPAGAAPFPTDSDGKRLAPLGNVGGNWVEADVCTSWTWGVPGELRSNAGTETFDPVSGATFTMTSALDMYDLVWQETPTGSSSAIGRPATGSGAVGVWSKPRAAGLALAPVGCATDADPNTICTSSAGMAAFESDLPTCAADPFCLSEVNLPPVMTSPGSARAVALGGPSSAVNLIFSDPDSDVVEVVFDPNDPKSLPLYGTLYDAQGQPVARADASGVVKTVYTLGSDGTLALTYAKGGGYTNLDDFTLTVRDGDGNQRNYTVTLYTAAVPNRLSASSLTVSQDASSVTFPVTVKNTDGAASVGTSVSLESSGGLFQISPATAVTGSDGKATFTVDVGATPAGDYTFTASVTVAGLSDPVTLSVPVTVVPTAGSISVASATGAAQGGVGQVTVSASDRAGAPFADVLVRLGVTSNGQPTTAVRPESGTCTTASDGTCTVPVLVAASAPAGTYIVTATSGSYTSTANVSVTQTVSRIEAAGGAGAVGTYQAAVADAGADGHWPLDERGGSTLTDIRGAVSATVYGPVTYAAPALAGTGTSITFSGTSRMCSDATSRSGPTTFEAWVRPDSFKPTSPTTSQVFGTSDSAYGRARLVFGGASGTAGDVPGFNFEAGGTSYSLRGRSLPPSATHHLVAVIDNGMAMLYVNGRLLDSVGFSGQFSFSGPLCAAGFGPVTASYLKGGLDELVVYPRALSSATVQKLYSAGRTDAGAVAGASVKVTQGSSADVIVRVSDGAKASMASVPVTATLTAAPDGVVLSSPGATLAAGKPLTDSGGQLRFRITVASGVRSGSYGPILLSAEGATVPVMIDIQQVIGAISAPSSVVVPQSGRIDIPVTITDVDGRPMNGVGLRARFEMNGVTQTPSGFGFSQTATSQTAPNGDNGVAPFAVTAAADLTPTGNVRLDGKIAEYGLRLFVPNPDDTDGDGVPEPLYSQYTTVIVSPNISAVETNPAILVPQGGSIPWTVKLVGGGARQPVSAGCADQACGLSFAPSVAYTDTNGVATFTATDDQGPNPAGPYNIVVTVASVQYPKVITVAAPPPAPTLTAKLNADATVTLQYFPTAGDGGSPILSYVVQRSTSQGFEAINTVTAQTSSTNTTYTSVGVAGSPAFYFRVRAVNAVGQGTWSDVRAVTLYTAPGAPTAIGTAVAPYGVSVKLSWQPPSNDGGSPVTGYQVEQLAPGAGTYVLLGTTTQTEYTAVTSLDGDYSFRVRATNAAGAGAAAETSVTVAVTRTPGSPGTPTTSVTGPQSVAVQFTAPISNGGATIDTYRVYAYTNTTATLAGGFGNPQTKQAGNGCAASSGSCTVTFDGLTAGITYYFRVTATNSVGEGSFSNYSAGTAITNQVPSAPRNLSGQVVGSAAVALTWDAPLSDGGSPILGYKVLRTSGNNTAYTTVTTTTARNFTDTGLTNGTMYSYRVVAFNSIGDSAFGNGPSVPWLQATVASNAGTGDAVNWPAGLNSGDVAVAALTATRDVTAAVAAGWTKITDTANPDGYAPYLWVGYRVLSGTETGDVGDWTVTGGTSSAVSNVTVSIFRGVATPNPLDATGAASTAQLDSTSNVASNGGVTTVTTNALVVTALGVGTASNVDMATSGFVEAYGRDGVANGEHVNYQLRPSPGATGTLSWSLAGAGAQAWYASASFALRPKATLSITPYGSPGAPAVTSADPAGPGTVTVTFAPATPNGAPITDYDIEYSTTSTFTAGSGTFSDGGISTNLTQSVTGLTNGTTYWFRVRAENAAGAGPWSAIGDADGATPYTTPGAPMIGSAVGATDGATVTWYAPASNGGKSIVGYRVYAYTDSAGTLATGMTNPQTASGNATSYTFTGLKSSSTYFFRVTAVNSTSPLSESTFSSYAQTATQAAAPTVTAVTAEAAVGTVPVTVTNARIGSSAATAAGTTITITTTTAVPAGATLVVSGAADNTSANAPVFTVSSPGLTWSVPIQRVSAATSTAGSGVAGFVATAPAPSGLASGSTITITLSSSVAARAAIAEYYTGVGATPVTAYAANGTASGASVTASTVATGNVVIGVLALESDATPAADTDTVNGTWGTQAASSAVVAVGTPTSNIGLTRQYKTVTAAGSQTYNPTSASTDWAAMAVVLPRLSTPSQRLSVAFTDPNAGSLAVTGYQYSTNGGTTWDNATQTASPIIISALSGNTQYTQLRLRASNINGTGPATANFSGTTFPDPPALSATRVDGQTVRLTLAVAGTATVSAYEVTYSTSTTTPATTITVQAPTSNTIDVSGLSSGVAYLFAARVQNSAGWSETSAPITYTSYTTPGVPMITNVTVTGASTARVTFTAPLSDGGSAITDYDVEYSTTANFAAGAGTFFEGGTTPAGTTTIDVTGLTGGVTYWFRTRASNAAGDGPWSNIGGTSDQLLVAGTAGTSSSTVMLLAGDGTSAGTFASDVASNGSAGIVNAIAVRTDGKLVIGGSFSTVNGTLRNGVAVLNADGTMPAALNVGSGTNGTVYALAAQTDGKIIVGGSFTSVNGVGRNNIARLNSDGTLDTAFNATGGVDGTVNSVTVQTDGKILVGGAFTTVNGVTVNRIARLNSDGTLDTTFNTSTQSANVGVNGTVQAVAVQSDGKIVIGGSFTMARGTITNYVARLNSDGTLDTTFNTGTSIGTDNAVNEVVQQADGRLVIGGSFTTVRGTSRNYVARLNSDGTLDTTFNAAGVNSVVNAIVVNADGRITMGGNFTSVAGVARNYVARLNSDGTLDTTLVPGTSALGYVRDLAQPTPAGTTLYLPPGAPTVGSVSAGNGRVTVSWTAPTTTGGSTVTDYRVYAYTATSGTLAAGIPNPQVVSATAACVSSPTSCSYIFTGLTNGATYYFRVTAVNAGGESTPSSYSSATTPGATPGAPIIGTVTKTTANGLLSLSVAFTAPLSDGGSTITGYQYSTDGGVTWRNRQSGTTASPINITTLSSDGVSSFTAGVTYRITIRAVNALGSGIASNIVDVVA